MILIYIAGKYTDKTFAGVDRNIKIADALGQKVVRQFGRLDVFVMIPHNNTPLHWDGIQPNEWFYDATIELLNRCDAMVYVDGDELRSHGTRGEIDFCIKNNKPYFPGSELGFAEFEEWLNSKLLT